MKKQLFLILLAIVVAGSPAGAQAPIEIEIEGKSAKASVSLAGGIAVDLEISFESVVGLSAADLGLSASLVDPADATLLARLPDAALVSIPGTFPVLVTIEPPSAGGLSFSGIATIELHTHNLPYTAASPLRLFSAPLGGDFEDITAGASSGSYRVRGSKGGFSEFLIVADLRSHDTVIQSKFGRAQTLLDTHAGLIAPEVRDELWVHLDSATWNWYSQNDLLAAIDSMESFLDTVVEHSGSTIPAVWRSSRDLENVAGELRSAGVTLIFSLGQKHSQGL